MQSGAEQMVAARDLFLQFWKNIGFLEIIGKGHWFKHDKGACTHTACFFCLSKLFSARKTGQSPETKGHLIFC